MNNQVEKLLARCHSFLQDLTLGGIPGYAGSAVLAA
jgi:hypothetical protein